MPAGGRADYDSVVTPKRGFLNKEKAPVRALNNKVVNYLLVMSTLVICFAQIHQNYYLTHSLDDKMRKE
nr:hypothetical protein Diarrp_00053 [Serratia entomophila]ULG14387.1 hypothetical protein 142p_00042 [Serratia proteamaculans]